MSRRGDAVQGGWRGVGIGVGLEGFALVEAVDGAVERVVGVERRTATTGQ